MACLLALVVAAAVLTVPPGKLTHAARTSPAEAFWRTAFPDAPMPEAIRELLHPSAGTYVPNDVKPKDNDDPPPPINFKYSDYRASPRNGAAAPSPNKVSKHVAGGSRNAATWPTTVFFLEDAVRVGESLPLFRSFPPRAATAPPLRLYTVRAVRAVEGSNFVVCRRGAGLSHDAAVYGCRPTGGPARAYAVDLAEDDAAVAAAAVIVCHTDTSRWDPEHAALRLLDVKPGGATVCHAVPGAQVLPAAKNEKSPALA